MSVDSWTFPQNRLKKIPPYSYLHVLNANTNVVHLKVGPQTYMCKDEETAIFGPARMIVIPPRHYVIVQNPVLTRTDAEGNKVVCFDKFGQAVLRHGDSEVRLTQDPFPRYPGEVANARVEPLKVLEPNTALRIQAIRDFNDRYSDTNVLRKAGQEWLLYGPATYIPQVEERIVAEVRPTIVGPDQALRLRARRDFIDRTKTKRLAGSEWLCTSDGSFLPEIDEEIVGLVKPHVLTDKIALRVLAEHSFVDRFGIERRPGTEWLVTSKETETYLPHVHATIQAIDNIITLGRREWCVISNPVQNGLPQYGKQQLIRGEKNFFLQPGEVIGKPREVHVLTAEQALPVQALEAFIDDSTGVKKARVAGEEWLVVGPREYWPPLEVRFKEVIPAYLTIGKMSFFSPPYLTQCVLLVLGAIFTLLFFWYFLF